MGRYTDRLFTDVIAAPATSGVVANRNANGTSVQANIVGTSGAVQANITLYGKHFNTSASGGIAMATIVLGDGTLTSDTQESFLSADYPFYYAVLNSISGTGASINLYIGH